MEKSSTCCDVGICGEERKKKIVFHLLLVNLLEWATGDVTRPPRPPNGICLNYRLFMAVSPWSDTLRLLLQRGGPLSIIKGPFRLKYR